MFISYCFIFIHTVIEKSLANLLRVFCSYSVPFLGAIANFKKRSQLYFYCPNLGRTIKSTLPVSLMPHSYPFSIFLNPLPLEGSQIKSSFTEL